MHYNGIKFEARHCGHRIFELSGQYEDPAVADPMVIKASFGKGKGGKIESLAIPFEPAVGDIVFRKMRDGGAPQLTQQAGVAAEQFE